MKEQLSNLFIRGLNHTKTLAIIGLATFSAPDAFALVISATEALNRADSKSLNSSSDELELNTYSALVSYFNLEGEVNDNGDFDSDLFSKKADQDRLLYTENLFQAELSNRANGMSFLQVSNIDLLAHFLFNKLNGQLSLEEIKAKLLEMQRQQDPELERLLAEMRGSEKGDGPDEGSLADTNPSNDGLASLTASLGEQDLASSFLKSFTDQLGDNPHAHAIRESLANISTNELLAGVGASHEAFGQDPSLDSSANDSLGALATAPSSQSANAAAAQEGGFFTPQLVASLAPQFVQEDSFNDYYQNFGSDAGGENLGYSVDNNANAGGEGLIGAFEPKPDRRTAALRPSSGSGVAHTGGAAHSSNSAQAADGSTNRNDDLSGLSTPHSNNNGGAPNRDASGIQTIDDLEGPGEEPKDNHAPMLNPLANLENSGDPLASISENPGFAADNGVGHCNGSMCSNNIAPGSSTSTEISLERQLNEAARVAGIDIYSSDYQEFLDTQKQILRRKSDDWVEQTPEYREMLQKVNEAHDKITGRDPTEPVTDADPFTGGALITMKKSYEVQEVEKTNAFISELSRPVDVDSTCPAKPIAVLRRYVVMSMQTGSEEIKLPDGEKVRLRKDMQKNIFSFCEACNELSQYGETSLEDQVAQIVDRTAKHLKNNKAFCSILQKDNGYNPDNFRHNAIISDALKLSLDEHQKEAVTQASQSVNKNLVELEKEVALLEAKSNKSSADVEKLSRLKNVLSLSKEAAAEISTSSNTLSRSVLEKLNTVYKANESAHADAIHSVLDSVAQAQNNKTNSTDLLFGSGFEAELGGANYENFVKNECIKEYIEKNEVEDAKFLAWARETQNASQSNSTTQPADITSTRKAAEEARKSTSINSPAISQKAYQYLSKKFGSSKSFAIIHRFCERVRKGTIYSKNLEDEDVALLAILEIAKAEERINNNKELFACHLSSPVSAAKRKDSAGERWETVNGLLYPLSGLSITSERLASSYLSSIESYLKEQPSNLGCLNLDHSGNKDISFVSDEARNQLEHNLSQPDSLINRASNLFAKASEPAQQDRAILPENTIDSLSLPGTAHNEGSNQNASPDCSIKGACQVTLDVMRQAGAQQR